MTKLLGLTVAQAEQRAAELGLSVMVTPYIGRFGKEGTPRIIRERRVGDTAYLVCSNFPELDSSRSGEGSGL